MQTRLLHCGFAHTDCVLAPMGLAGTLRLAASLALLALRAHGQPPELGSDVGLGDGSASGPVPLQCGDNGQWSEEKNKCECGETDVETHLFVPSDYWDGELCDDHCDGHSNSLLLPLVCFMLYMFVGLAIVCDEYFVPSLNILCERLQMPDDVAGATFMAAGASSPELFASLIGVLSNSAVGVGTVVGSELFNMLIIVGAVCLCTSGGLMLDWRPLAREVIFFLGSLALLIFVLSDGQVEMWQACLLIAGYSVYVCTCAYYPQIIRVLCPLPEKDDADDEEMGGTGGLEQKFLPGGGDSLQQKKKPYDRNGPNMVSVSGEMFGFEYGSVKNHGFLFKSSKYYTKTRMSGSKWQRRWFMLSEDELKYCKNPIAMKQCRSINMYEAKSAHRTTPTEFELVAKVRAHTQHPTIAPPIRPTH